MQYLSVKEGPKDVSRIILGCMRMPSLSVEEAARQIEEAVALGINFFDHATCYGRGDAEARFGEALRKTDLKREDLWIQDKCGLCFERNEFDWSKENIIKSVEESLKRLQVEYLDVLLLHRPDLIYEPEEVADAFQNLESSGKVRFFGVSNVPMMQLKVLKKYVKQPLQINQLQLSLPASQLIDQTLYVNDMTTERSIDRDNGLLDYCRLKEITIQAWSPLQFGKFEGCFVDHPAFPELNQALGSLAEKYGVSKTAIAVSWILRHPAKMQVVAGTMHPEHLRQYCDATKVELTHREWYQLYLASGKKLP